jgi:lipopolysaccharide export LptBFGC system permease protein LptF
MRLLDRYIIRNFLQPYIYCIIGFLSIRLIFDISDNSSIIFDQNAPFGLVVRFYWTQIPQVLVILLPVALLLALLFSLGRMSRANDAQVFRNRTDYRTWYIAHFKPGDNRFEGVQVVQQDAAGNITRNYLATEAFYEPATGNWRFDMTKLVDYDLAGNITHEQLMRSLTIKGCAAWTPNAIFFLVGLYLLHLRATNREAPSFHLSRLRRNMAAT